MSLAPAMRRQLAWLFWLYLGLLLLLTLVPVPYLKPLSSFTFWDKAEHGLAFAVLAWLALLLWPRRPLRLWLALLALGGVIELLQAASGWRSGEWIDWLADGIGLAFGWLIWLSTRRFLPRGLR